MKKNKLDKPARLNQIKYIKIIPAEKGFKIESVPEMVYTQDLIVLLLRAVVALVAKMDAER